MKRNILSIAFAALAISITFTSCSKDETAAPAPATPFIKVKDSFNYTTLDTNNFYKKPLLVVNAAPTTGGPLKQGMLEVKVGTITYGNSAFFNLSPAEFNGFQLALPVSNYTKGLPLTVGSVITFIFSVKDSSNKIGTSSISYTVIKDNAILSSTEIELGAQTNTTIPYKFVGLANNFGTYTPGLTGTAKANSDKIDFVYYYGTTDKNTFAAPSNADGAKIIWNSEINMWSVQNKTKFLISTVTSTEFDNIKNTTKVDDTFAALDFTIGTTDKITSLAVGSVYAFQTAAGVKGLAKFTAISADAMGSTKVVLICQN